MIIALMSTLANTEKYSKQALLPSALADGRKEVSSTPALAKIFLNEPNIMIVYFCG